MCSIFYFYFKKELHEISHITLIPFRSCVFLLYAPRNMGVYVEGSTQGVILVPNLPKSQNCSVSELRHIFLPSSMKEKGPAYAPVQITYFFLIRPKRREVRKMDMKDPQRPDVRSFATENPNITDTVKYIIFAKYHKKNKDNLPITQR